MTLTFIAGSTGHFGKILANHWLSKGEKVRLLIRKESLNKPEVSEFKEKGAEIIEGDVSNHEFLVKHLQGVDTVISSLLFPNDEFALLKAAQEAKVGLYVPSIWSTPTTNLTKEEIITKEMKESIVQTVEQSGLNYIIFYHLAWLNNLSFLGFDYKNNKVEVVEDSTLGFIHTHDIAALAYKFISDKKLFNKRYYLETEKHSIEELVKIFEKHGKKFEVTKLSQKEALEKIGQHFNPFNFGLVLSYQIRYLFTLKDKVLKGFEADNKKLFPEHKGITAEEYVQNFLNGKDGNVF